MTTLTPRFTDAVDYARTAHAGHYRKGTRIPYLYHLLGVASLALEHGGDEDQAIAGLLHDVLEDCGHEHEASIRARFGHGVADIVLACTDGHAEQKAAATSPAAKRLDWLVRKQRYLAHLAEGEPAALLVSGCDKLHNARAIVGDLEGAAGQAVFERFTAGRDGTLRYYAAVAEVFTRRQVAVAPALDAAVDRMHALAGEPTRRTLEGWAPAQTGLD